MALQKLADDVSAKNPDRATLLLAAAGAATVLGPGHSATKVFAKAARTMDKVEIWHARLAMKTLRRDQRAAIAAAGDIVIQVSRCVTFTG